MDNGGASSGTRPEHPDGALPHPDSIELKELIKGTEAREAYRWLYMNRTDPQPMSKWVEHSQLVFGKTNSNTGRRLREVYSTFDVRRFRQEETRFWVYELTGRRHVRADDAPISKKLEVQVYTTKGRFCAMCGLGPAEGVKLQIDHIIPREWGGKPELSNLEPLCAPHNHGKRAFFSTFNEAGPLIKSAVTPTDPWTRIGELLKGFWSMGKACPVDLIFIVAGETHKGDPLKRLRELRFVLGWKVKSSRVRGNDGVTHVTYELTEVPPPWPPAGPAQQVLEYERARRARNRNKE